VLRLWGCQERNQGSRPYIKEGTLSQFQDTDPRQVKEHLDPALETLLVDYPALRDDERTQMAVVAGFLASLLQSPVESQA
jgi:hypothetical protein